ncbi:1-acyl-sn-glycerol-3-phosphate acyltransferase, partial [Bacteroides xylanisolvens]|nr:1-acyl-sn-glycerol-3-phosphate acyltransferase [Bacteroides xylanisolvens]
DKYPEAERYEVLKLIDRRAMKGGRITIDAHGVENLPAKDGFMFFPNHQGLFDVLAILQACPRPFSVVMK